MAEYEYQYYLVSQKWRILFSFPKVTENQYEYYSATHKWPNTNTNIIPLHNNDRIQI